MAAAQYELRKDPAAVAAAVAVTLKDLHVHLKMAS
jgi:hypothetical protein